jgi:hypothetical protein
MALSNFVSLKPQKELSDNLKSNNILIIIKWPIANFEN